VVTSNDLLYGTIFVFTFQKLRRQISLQLDGKKKVSPLIINVVIGATRHLLSFLYQENSCLDFFALNNFLSK